MYTDDEIEDIREENGEDDTGGTDSYTSARKLSTSLLLSFVLLSIVAYSVFGTGAAAVVVSGAGGFYAEIDQINANGAFIYPTVAQTANCESTVTTASGRPAGGQTALPLLRLDLAGASIPAGDSVRFIKTVKTPNLLGSPPIDNFTVIIEQGNNPGPTQLEDTTVLVKSLEGENLGLGRTIGNESFTRPAGDNPAPKNEIFGPSVPNYFENTGQKKDLSVLGEFAIKGETASVTDANAVAHLVSFESLRIPDLNLKLEYNQFGQYAPSGGCPI
jgi:hypothetical protein